MSASFAKTYITVLGVVLVVGGVLGFIENPLFDPDALFAADALHPVSSIPLPVASHWPSALVAAATPSPVV